MNDGKLKIILIGPPGAGKGTQAEKICEEYGVFHLSTGNLIREEIKKGTLLGKQAKDMIARGKLIDDTTIIRMVNKVIVEKPHILFDGFPRTTKQEDILDVLCDIDAVFDIQVSDKEVKRRILSRKMVELNGQQFTFVNEADAEEFVKVHGGTIFQRDDDTFDVVKNRLTVYHKEAEPVIKHYKKLGKLYIIDGEQSIDEVWNDINKIMKTLN